MADGFSALSLRVGMAQGLSTAGAELPEIMTSGRWGSPTMPAKYTEAQAAEREAVAPYYRGPAGIQDNVTSRMKTMGYSLPTTYTETQAAHTC